jgi:hypothetical protein
MLRPAILATKGPRLGPICIYTDLSNSFIPTKAFYSKDVTNLSGLSSKSQHLGVVNCGKTIINYQNNRTATFGRRNLAEWATKELRQTAIRLSCIFNAFLLMKARSQVVLDWGNLN